jgi:hypothetical protein
MGAADTRVQVVIMRRSPTTFIMYSLCQQPPAHASSLGKGTDICNNGYALLFGSRHEQGLPMTREQYTVGYRIDPIVVAGRRLDGIIIRQDGGAVLGVVRTRPPSRERYVQPWYILGIGIAPAPDGWRARIIEELRSQPRV